MIPARELCSIPNCDSRSQTRLKRGLCPKHYQRLRKHGDPSAVLPYDGDPVERALVRVLSLVTVAPSECWEWPRRHNNAGYAMTDVHNRACLLHRFLYVQLVGPVPDGLQLDHLCRNRGCANPDHLEPVTPLENTRRGVKASRINTGLCNRGHDLAVEGTPDKRGYLVCKRCSRERRKVRYHELRAAGYSPQEIRVGKRGVAA